MWADIVSFLFAFQILWAASVALRLSLDLSLKIARISKLKFVIITSTEKGITEYTHTVALTHTHTHI